jgi:hypothetical protein
VIPAPTAPPPKVRKRRGGVGLGVAAAIVVLLCLAGLGYKILSGHAAAGPGGAGHHHPTGTVTRHVVAPDSPAGVVRAYVAAINAHHYRIAWRIGGYVTSKSRRAFIHGYRGTAHVSVKIISIGGRTVLARLVARQSNGTVKLFEGTYTVFHGRIVASDVDQIDNG